MTLPTTFGRFGGMYVPETLMAPLREIEAAWIEAREDTAFTRQLDLLLRDYAGRPTPLYHAASLSQRTSSTRIWRPSWRVRVGSMGRPPASSGIIASTAGSSSNRRASVPRI